MLPLAIAALLGLSALLIVMAPLYAPEHAAGAAEASASDLAERETAAKSALQDIELDHQLGNLADDDYRGLRERYTRRALAALKGRYDRERALDDAIESQVRALRAAPSPKPPQSASKPNGGATDVPQTSSGGHPRGTPRPPAEGRPHADGSASRPRAGDDNSSPTRRRNARRNGGKNTCQNGHTARNGRGEV